MCSRCFNIFILGKDFKNKLHKKDKQDVENHFNIGNITNAYES